MQRTDWHIVSEYEELSQRNGSAVLTVARSLQAAAVQLGHRSWIVGSISVNNNLENTLELLRRKPRILDGKIARTMDNGIKYAFGKSSTTPGLKRSDVIPSHIYCHNQPWIIAVLRQRFPSARIYLYAHNKLMQGARASTIRAIIEKYDGVICVSDFIRQELSGRAGMARADVQRKMTVHLNGVDSAPYKKNRFQRQSGI